MKSRIIRCLLAAVLCLATLSGTAVLYDGPVWMEPSFAEEVQAGDTDPSDLPPDIISDDPAGDPADDPSGQPSDDPSGDPSDNPSDDPSDNPPDEPTEPVITSFTDVQDSNAYYFVPVYWAVEKGITNGTNAELQLFSPDLNCTRGQIVTFLWRAAGSPEPASEENPFSDIAPEDYYYKAVLWAVEKDITNGTTATTFEPSAVCTRGQSVTLIWRYAGSPGNGGDTFSDVKSGMYYYKSVFWAVQNGVTNGVTPKQFAPDASCTRGQIVTFLYHALLDSSVTKEEAGASGLFSVSDIDGQKATFRINATTLKADSPISEVRATVSSGSGNDLRWFTLSPVDYGSFYKTVEAMDLSGFATYTVKWYIVTEDGGLVYMDSATAEVKKVNYATAADIGNRQFRITIEGVNTGVSSISACVWSEKNGNDDVKWTGMTKKDSTTWQVTVNCIDYKDSGVFLADLYSNDSKLLATLRFNVPASYLVLTIQEQLDRETEKVYASVGRDLRACFNYSAGITYRSTPSPEAGYTNSQWYALYGFRNHKGHCYVHAATFYWLAKNLGYDVKYIQGYVPRKGGGLITHGWVEIKINGTTYVCDPNFTNETGRNGYMIRYGQSGTWRYQSYRQYS